MTATITAKGLISIRHGNQVLAMAGVGSRNPEVVAAELNQRLRYVGVTGNDVSAWVLRRMIAKDLLGEVST
jgi:hypothetical protein